MQACACHGHKLEREANMKDQFCKQLNNFLDDVTTSRSRCRFLIRAVSNGCSLIHLHAIIFPDGVDTVEVRLIADDNSDYITDGIADSIYEDITRLACHYFPGYREIKCKATFGKYTIERGWNINDVITERNLICE